MTPFDASALLAVLLAFYPVVSPAALARARLERPDYFASGTLVGSKRDKLALPDGRVFDCIYGTNTADTRWQMIDVTNGGGGGGVVDPFALEAGPLAPVDPALVPRVVLAHPFVDLTSRALDGVGASHTAIDAGYQAIAETSNPAPFLAGAAGELGPAATSHAATLATVDQADPTDLFSATDGATHTAAVQSGLYDEPAPADQPVPDPGPPPDLAAGPREPPQV